VFVLGSNAYGQLGLEGREFAVPTPLKFKHPVEMIGCGAMHSALFTRTGCLYTFGRNVEGLIIIFDDDYYLFSFFLLEKGQLGLGDNTDRCSPCLVNSLAEERRVESLSLGSYHTVFLSTNGPLYECGRNKQFSTFQKIAHHASIVACAGNATVSFSKADGRVLIWGWSGGPGVVNEVKQFENERVEQLYGSKFEITVVFAGGSRVASIRNEEVNASHHNFDVISNLSDLSVLGGVAEMSLGNLLSGAITLSGKAVSWKRDNSTGKMCSLPVVVVKYILNLCFFDFCFCLFLKYNINNPIRLLLPSP
jgi:alpha-tubulin suppressor-like RCC1 family protein